MNMIPFVAKALYWSKEQKYEEQKYELFSNVGHDRYIWLSVFLSYFFSQSFVDLGAFWCHLSTCFEDKVFE